jgi:hypothetical protein
LPIARAVAVGEQDTSARITMLPGNVGANVTFSTSLPSGVLCDDVYLLV